MSYAVKYVNSRRIHQAITSDYWRVETHVSPYIFKIKYVINLATKMLKQENKVRSLNSFKNSFSSSMLPYYKIDVTSKMQMFHESQKKIAYNENKCLYGPDSSSIANLSLNHIPSSFTIEHRRILLSRKQYWKLIILSKVMSINQNC